MHFAITGQTAAEIIADRADREKPHMGLTTWRKAPKGKILKTDVRVAKNYLSAKELKNLNHIVDMYLDYAELQASRGRLMKMRDWTEKRRLSAVQRAGDSERQRKSVTPGGMTLAEKEYKVFRIEQDHSYESDFDRVTKRLKDKKEIENA